ncbi:MAG: hypothetical protein QOK39_333 [Acidimicrobiaceae bacterium]|jgi:hypothetical protein|nr:hypothetical protein [Acidimicrobiaceae bacterium]
MTAINLPRQISVVNIGLPLFADAIRDQGRPVAQVEWRIPAEGDPEAVAALRRAFGTRSAAIDKANAEVVRRLDEGVPQLMGIEAAASVVPDLDDRTILHSGPPIAWPDICDPLRRSIRAAVMAEGWASTPDQATTLIEMGSVRLEAANHHDTVVPMASAIGPGAPVYIVDNATGGTRAYSPINQGPGQVAWFGMETAPAVERLVFLRQVAGPLLARAIEESGPIDIFSLVAQGVQMGDDVHMRTQATNNLLIRHLLPQLMSLGGSDAQALARFLAGNHLFFLNIAMAGAKALTLWAEQVDGSSVVTSMARNGTTFGIRLAGSQAQTQEWFITDSPPIGRALYQSGFGPDDAAPDIGDSAVLELVGLGGPAAAASPAVAGFLGGSMADAVAATEDMERICAGRSTRFKLPILGFRGTPLGVDVRKVVETGITPRINTGILHASAGTGQIGAGVAEAPVACFREALLALSNHAPAG